MFQTNNQRESFLPAPAITQLPLTVQGNRVTAGGRRESSALGWNGTSADARFKPLTADSLFHRIARSSATSTRSVSLSCRLELVSQADNEWRIGFACQALEGLSFCGLEALTRCCEGLTSHLLIAALFTPSRSRRLASLVTCRSLSTLRTTLPER